MRDQLQGDLNALRQRQEDIHDLLGDMADGELSAEDIDAHRALLEELAADKGMSLEAYTLWP